MVPTTDITQAAIDAVAKARETADVRKDITTSTGLVAYNLEPAAKLLVPVITPLRNLIPRVGNTRGGTSANWKVITALDTARTDLFTAEGTKAGTISYSTTPKAASYATISKGDNVSFQAQWAGKTFEDVKANAIIRLLKNVMIHEEQAILGARVNALGTVTAPTCTAVAAGGTIPTAAHYYVVVRAITNVGRGKKSSETDVTTLTSTNDWGLKMYTPYVEGAQAYDWYMGTVSGTLYKQARTYINSALLTSYSTAGIATPADDSADALAFDGVLAQCSATYAQVSTLATGTEGTGTKLALDDLDAMLQNIWDNAKGNPDVIIVNSREARTITDLWVKANGGPTVYVQTVADQAGATAGYRLTHFINKVTGKNIPLVTHPYLMQGTLLALTMEMPFPASDIMNPWEVEARQEYYQLDYPLTSPKWEFEVMVDEALKGYFPGAQGVIRNIAAGV